MLCMFWKKTFHGHVTPWQLRKMCQTMKNTLYHAESQLFEKTNIRQNVR